MEPALRLHPSTSSRAGRLDHVPRGDELHVETVGYKQRQYLGGHE